MDFFHSLPVPEFWEWIFFIPFPFPNFGNGFFPFPSHSRILGMFFFHSLPVPEFWEWVFFIPFPFPNFGNGIIHSRSRSRTPKCHSRSPLPELQLPLKRRAGASKPQVSPPSNRMEPALVSPPWIKPTMDQTHHGTSPPWIKPTFKTCKAGDVKAPLIYL